jgi:Fe-S-cluster containining protein
MGFEENAPIFECTLCGDCCRGYGGTYISQGDTEAIAAFLGLSPQSFLMRYCVGDIRHRMLDQGPDGFCVFYEGKCAIHPVKPRMCRTWPYLKSVIVDYSNWQAMGSVCPGIRVEAPRTQVLAEIAGYHQIPQEK